MAMDMDFPSKLQKQRRMRSDAQTRVMNEGMTTHFNKGYTSAALISLLYNSSTTAIYLVNNNKQHQFKKM